MSGHGAFDSDSPGLALALTVRFLLELALLAGVAAVAWQVVPGWWRWPAMILVPIAVAVLWGLLLSPKAAVELPGPAKLVIEAALFLGSGVSLVAVGMWIPAVIGVAVWIIDRIALALLED